MLEAPNMFPDDPDAQQAFVDALPIVAELLNASARIPANSQAGRSVRGNAQVAEQQRAQKLYIDDLTEQLQLLANRASMSLEEFRVLGDRTVKRGASGQPVLRRFPTMGQLDHPSQQLRDKAVEAERRYAAAIRSTSSTFLAYREAKEAEAFAKAALDEARRALAAHDQSSLAA